MGNMIIDLQLASENTEGLPSEAQNPTMGNRRSTTRK